MICTCIDALSQPPPCIVHFQSIITLLESTCSLKIARGYFRFCSDLTFVTTVREDDIFAVARPSACFSLRLSLFALSIHLE